jgi:hypothetical protein
MSGVFFLDADAVTHGGRMFFVDGGSRSSTTQINAGIARALLRTDRCPDTGEQMHFDRSSASGLRQMMGS